MGGTISTDLMVDLSAQPVALKGNIFLDRLDLDPIIGSKNTASSSHNKLADTRFDSSYLRDFNLDGQINIQHILRKQVDIGAIQVKLHLNKGQLLIAPIAINMEKIGQLSASFLIDASTDITHLKLETHSDKIDYGYFLRKVRKSKKASGKLYMKSALEADGNSVYDIIRNAKGKVLLYGGKGVLGQTDLFITLNAGNLLNEIMPKFLKQDKQVKLKCFYTQWDIDKSVIYSDNSLFRFSSLDLALAGKYDPIKGKVNILISPKARGFQILDVAIPVQVKGPINNPRFIPGALPGVSVLGLSELNLQEPDRLFKFLNPLKDLFKSSSFQYIVPEKSAANFKPSSVNS